VKLIPKKYTNHLRSSMLCLFRASMTCICNLLSTLIFFMMIYKYKYLLLLPTVLFFLGCSWLQNPPAKYEGIANFLIKSYQDDLVKIANCDSLELKYQPILDSIVRVHKEIIRLTIYGERKPYKVHNSCGCSVDSMGFVKFKNPRNPNANPLSSRFSGIIIIPFSNIPVEYFRSTLNERVMYQQREYRYKVHFRTDYSGTESVPILFELEALE
jgi:hypothetical protein